APHISQAPVLMLRPRAWNMVEHNMMVGGKEAPGPLFDFGLLMFHCGEKLFRNGSGPFFYLSKLLLLSLSFWFFKFLILVGITVGAFFIPDGIFNTVWYYFGMVGSFFFIVVQLILLVDFAHSWNQSWLLKAEEGNSKFWYAALLTFTAIFYALAFSAVVVFYVYYTKPDDCTEHKVFISLNFIFCIIVSVVSILPKVQDAQPSSGLLQASFISLYTMYITWSAMSNNPSTSPQPVRERGREELFLLLLPDWFPRPDAAYETMKSTMPSVWVKIGSSWFGLAIFLWTLIAPVILSDRDFS
ncbi:serine incorporator 3-like, partial [Notothenia coriiceps]|uniref:Serine incorporator 3-like n=1 Tax=Notothenia coriiceps TaxID=8208 RepID=A0A6I9PUU4_9TELE